MDLRTAKSRIEDDYTDVCQNCGCTFEPNISGHQDFCSGKCDAENYCDEE